jgi:hypothetical protein
MANPRSTGMPGVDAEQDFLRARRRASYARLLARLRFEPDDVHMLLPYEEVVEALGLVSESRIGLQVVPLDAILGTSEIRLSDPWLFPILAEAIEAWGFRAIQDRHEPLDRPGAALMWLETEYRPVVAMLREARLIGELTETEAYMHVVAERYRLLRTDRWNDDVLQRVIEGGKRRRRSP